MLTLTTRACRIVFQVDASGCAGEGGAKVEESGVIQKRVRFSNSHQGKKYFDSLAPTMTP